MTLFSHYHPKDSQEDFLILFPSVAGYVQNPVVFTLVSTITLSRVLPIVPFTLTSC